MSDFDPARDDRALKQMAMGNRQPNTKLMKQCANYIMELRNEMKGYETGRDYLQSQLDDVSREAEIYKDSNGDLTVEVLNLQGQLLLLKEPKAKGKGKKK